MKATAVIVAAGASKRLPARERKPYLLINGKPILIYTLEKFTNSNYVEKIILVVNKKDLKLADHLLRKSKIKKEIKIVVGGKTRRDSVYQGLLNISWQADYIIVHDAVRPLFKKTSLEKLTKAAKIYGASILAIPVIPTIKEINKNFFIKNTLDRQKLWEAQTPQVFKKEILLKAYKGACRTKRKATDDSSLVEDLGIKVKIIKGQEENIKITTKKDLTLASILLKERK